MCTFPCVKYLTMEYVHSYVHSSDGGECKLRYGSYNCTVSVFQTLHNHGGECGTKTGYLQNENKMQGYVLRDTYEIENEQDKKKKKLPSLCGGMEGQCRYDQNIMPSDPRRQTVFSSAFLLDLAWLRPSQPTAFVAQPAISSLRKELHWGTWTCT